MAHHTVRSGFSQLADRLNRFPQGAPPGPTLFKLLRVLMSEREAELISLLPIRPFKAETAARAWNMPLAQAQSKLDELAGRALLLDILGEQGYQYVLPPPMAGFFEFSLMRLRNDLDQHLLSELFYQYLNVEEDFIRSLFIGGETQMGRIFVQEPMLPTTNTLTVLDYERASHIIRTARHIGVGMCYCRHKMSHIGQACNAPMNICMTFGNTADSLIRHEYARRIDAAECLDLLAQAYEHGLVQFGENAQENVSFLCNCCGCCCEAMQAARRFAILNPIHTTNFLPTLTPEACTGCGKCISACPVEAMSLVSAHDPLRPQARKAHLNVETCLGCGVCVRSCPHNALKLEQRPQRVITPVNGAHRIVLMAIERGNLQNLIFDQQALASHRAMAAILGVILRLPPAKQILANKQIKSRYLAALLDKAN